jgi:anti-anti-sigma factor
MVISLAGEWDIYRKDELQSRLEPAYSERNVVFDLTTAKYVTSTLICALVIAHKERTKNELPAATLAVKSAFVRRLLSATGIEGLFPIFSSVEAALDGAGSRQERAI